MPVALTSSPPLPVFVFMAIGSLAEKGNEASRPALIVASFTGVLYFFFVLGYSLPPLGYRTRLDNYMNLCFFIVFSLCIYSFLVFRYFKTLERRHQMAHEIATKAIVHFTAQRSLRTTLRALGRRAHSKVAGKAAAAGKGGAVAGGGSGTAGEGAPRGGPPAAGEVGAEKAAATRPPAPLAPGGDSPVEAAAGPPAVALHVGEGAPPGAGWPAAEPAAGHGGGTPRRGGCTDALRCNLDLHRKLDVVAGVVFSLSFVLGACGVFLGPLPPL
jgi:hypothetical protein